MKVVIDTNDLSFKLSNTVLEKYLKLKNQIAYFYKWNYKKAIYEKIHDIDLDNCCNSICTYQDLGEFINHIPNNILIDSDSIKRNDETLIQVIEELGLEKSSGVGSELKIVEIPDNVKWEINCYDDEGEIIEEVHRTWS